LSANNRDTSKNTGEKDCSSRKKMVKSIMIKDLINYYRQQKTFDKIISESFHCKVIKVNDAVYNSFWSWFFTKTKKKIILTRK